VRLHVSMVDALDRRAVELTRQLHMQVDRSKLVRTFLERALDDLKETR
jgi:hypothetical protein